MTTSTPNRRRLTFSLRTFLIVTLGLTLVLGYIGRARIAAERERQMQELIAKSFCNSEWIERPKVIGRPTAQDAAARKVLLEVLDEKQDPEYRRDYQIALPEHGTGLPQDYDVLVYGKYIDSSASRVEVRVRGEKVLAELITARKFCRGELPLDTVDGKVRQLMYGFIAQAELRDPSKMDIGGRGYASHAPYVQIEVFSRAQDSPYHLKTQSWQLLADDVSTMTDGVDGFSHTHFCNELTALLRETLPALRPTDELKQEIVRRLQAIQPPKDGGQENDALDADPTTMPLNYYRRDDLAAVDALVFSKLAIAWRIKEAAAEMKRLYLLEAEAQPAIVTAEHSTELLREALTGEDWNLFRFALDFVVDNLTPESSELLAWSWPRAKDDDRRKHILTTLRRAARNAEQTKQSDVATYQGLLKQFGRLLQKNSAESDRLPLPPRNPHPPLMQQQ